MKSPWRIKPLHVPELPALIEVGEEPLSFGRDGTNEVRLPGDAYPSVSSHHARVSLIRNDLVIEDLGSTNGTLVNGHPVQRKLLESGDTFRLGPEGPRFVGIRVPQFQTGGDGDEGSLGVTKFVALEAPLEGPVANFSSEPSRARRFANAVGALALVTFAVVTWSNILRGEGQASEERLAAIGEEQQSSLTELLANAEQRLRYAEQGVIATAERTDQRWIAQQRELQYEREQFQSRLASIEEIAAVTPNELRLLREELSETKHSLRHYRGGEEGPNRLEEVARVRTSVVLIEKQVVYRDLATGRYLHMSKKEGDNSPLNLEDRGEIVTMDASTGSGFAISEDGWILTNAHVLKFSDALPPIGLGDGVTLEPEQRVAVVFSNTDVRHRARVVEMVTTDGLDLGLIQIEPFDSMPYLEDFTTAINPPAPGTEVFLFGFPLGNYALQQGDTVVASTFKGILSRNVAEYMQIDAGVYPGNSGGPVTDASGRVIGLVFSVQNNLDGTTAAGIGYAMPVSAVDAIWPPSSN